MSEAIFSNFDVWMGLTVVIVIFVILTLQDLKGFYRSDRRLSFKILVSCLLLSAISFVFIFLGGLWYILGHTSFVNHIKDGDLIEHLRRGL